MEYALIILSFVPLRYSENILMPNYCAIQEVLCDGRNHIACFSRNNLRRPRVTGEIEIDGGALLRKINVGRDSHHLTQLAWDKELVELSKWINVYTKNDCLISSKFVDIEYTELRVYKYILSPDNYAVRNLTKNPLIEVIGCVQMEETKLFKRNYTLKCLYNASNKSTPEEYKKRTKSKRFLINLKLYDIWLLYGLIILVWSGVIIVPIFRYVAIRFARIKLTQGMG